LTRVRFRAARRQAAKRHGCRHELQKAPSVEHVDNVAETRSFPLDYGDEFGAIGEFF
jgi:hypothetical protein